MARNGLFLISIGLLVLVFTMNIHVTTFNIMNLLIAAAFIISGIGFFLRGSKKDKQKKEEKK